MRRASVSWRWLGISAAVASIISCEQQQPAQPSALKPQTAVNAGGQPFPIEFTVIAHQDDWQLFQGDRTASAVQTAQKVVIVYVTAGDAGTHTSLPAYWQARETASMASVDSMTAPGPWSCANVTLNAHVIWRCTKANTVSYYMRLPDGNGEGQGFGLGSLARLRSGAISTFRAVNSSTTYTSWGDLLATFQALVAAEGAGQADANVAMHMHDWDEELNGGDHSDHMMTGEMVKAAALIHPWNRFWYVGYNSLHQPANVSGAQLAKKWKLIVAYDDVMMDLMGETIIGTSHAEEWSERTIFRSELSPLPPPPPGIPFAPTALAATAVSATSIDVTWIDNSNDEDGFHLERAPDAGGVAGTYAEIASVGANVATYSDADVAADTRYWYRVRAFTAVGNSGYSNAASASTAPPAAPSALVTTAVNAGQINLAWTDNAPDEQGFSVERADDAGGVAGTYTEIASVAAGVATYSNTGLTGGTRYWYRVRAYNALGNSSYSNEASAATPAPPAAPSALLATPFSTTRIDLAWTDNATDEQGFRIERAPNAGGVAGTYTQIASVGANVRTYSNSGLSAGVTYWYRVRAYNTAGNSAYSNEANAMTQPPPPPGAPSALVASTTSATRLDLAWVDNATNEQGFRVERAPDAGGTAGTFAQIASVGANVRAYGNTGLTGGTRYWYRVRAYNTAGNSAYSNEANATTLGPLAPSNLQAVAISGAVVNLTWTDNAVDETAYRIQRAPDAGGVPGTWATVTTVGANVTTYRNTGRASATTYWYRVRAENAVGNSAYTPGTSVTTMVQVAPSGLTANAYLVGTQRNVDLTWSPGTELTVDVYRNGSKIVTARANDGGPYNNKPSASLALPITYQVCVNGKTGAANCSAVVSVTSF